MRDRGLTTPWGLAQSVVKVCPGVVWVSTPGHGGLLVGRAAATRFLSDVALGAGARFGQYLAYEEDNDCCAPFAEHPEWYRAAMQRQGAWSAKADLELKTMFRDAFCKYHDPVQLQVAGAAIRAEFEVARGLRLGDHVTLRDSYQLCGAPIGPLTISQLKPLVGRTVGGMLVRIPRIGIVAVARAAAPDPGPAR